MTSQQGTPYLMSWGRQDWSRLYWITASLHSVFRLGPVKKRQLSYPVEAPASCNQGHRKQGRALSEGQGRVHTTDRLGWLLCSHKRNTHRNAQSMAAPLVALP